jgi:Cu/Ag efflux pump CusA
VADVTIGPEMRRGIAELDGEGEVAGGIVVMRFGENALVRGGSVAPAPARRLHAR